MTSSAAEWQKSLLRDTYQLGSLSPVHTLTREKGGRDLRGICLVLGTLFSFVRTSVKEAELPEETACEVT